MLRVPAALSVLAALVGGLLTTAPATAQPAGPVAGARAGVERPAAPPRLHATHGPQAAIVDARGARVLLRGVNVNGLGEYYQANPELPSTVPLTSDDFQDIAALGFNSVRLIVSWSRLEPTRGAYDTAYVAKIKQALRWARLAGLYVVLDMHQDAWGLAVETPQDVTCPPNTSPNNGWDGAPAWATITDGQSTCRPFGTRELAPAVLHAWQHFYDDTDGIQTELVRTWGRLARDVATNPTVAGYDLLNEPGIGLDQANATTDLGAFYRRAIAAIRAGERKGGGFSHVAFFEPNVRWSNQGTSPVPPVEFTQDQNIAFAPHIYAEAFAGIPIATGFKNAATVAKSYGVTVWGGEWGFWPEHPADDADKVRRYAAAEDRWGYGGAWWDWKQACGDPHMIPAPGGQPAAVSPSLVRYTCPDQVAQPVDPAFGDVLGRTVPRAVPGRTTTLTSNSRTGAFELAGRFTPGSQRCALQVWAPARFARHKPRVTGITHLRRSSAPGGVVLSGCVADSFRLRMG
ncbi:glycoside hydrolase family 5 protein [Nocardioides sp.]|uniref:glycoside hydrolase family 5 protein n=1 Tax=Nocardioides sp. TaxID=35761 RepID=UPI00378440AB